MDESFDLFGNPVRVGKGMRGRPPFVPTEKDRNKVKLLLALGWVPGRVANALGVSLATLKRYFRAELSEREAMRDRLDARRIEVAAEAALAGNMAAMRIFEAMIERSDRMGKVERITAPRPTADERALDERPGKKRLKRDGAAQAIARDPDLLGWQRTLN